MINELINSINEMLVEKFPDAKIFLSKSGKEVERPSFFIRYVTSKQKDLNRNSNVNNITMKIIYYPPLDDSMNADLIARNEIWDIMRELFSSAYIKVLDRSARIKKLRGRSKSTEIHLKLKIKFTQDKTFNTPQSPTAEKINLKF